jgi:hypothetical protein
MGASANRGQVWKSFLTQPAVPVTAQDQFWSNMCKWISAGKVVPVISGSLVYDQIFSELAGQDSDEGDNCVSSRMNAQNALATIWASRVPYPLPDSTELARVAQYVRSKSKGLAEYKQSYLDFLKTFLLEYAAQIKGNPELAAELMPSIDEYDFTALAVQELELVQFGPGCSDPISVLASLPLPFYITTSYHNVLEYALQKFGKEPVSQACFWSSPLPPPDQYTPVEQLAANPKTPIVYHLYGMESFPLTMVLGEDDYLDFLIRVTADQGKPDSILPSYLINALKFNLLLMLGYRLYDWDFRTLFRGIISTRDRQDMTFTNTIIQLALNDQYQVPRDDQMRESVNQVQEYLQEYFNPLAFEIRWNNPAEFLDALQKEWKNRRQK